MADIELVIKIPEEEYRLIKKSDKTVFADVASKECMLHAIKNGTPLTPKVLADLLMEERIRGKLDYNTTFDKDIIPDVKCRLTVSIRDNRPCYCGAELREVWRESEVSDADSN